MKDCDEKYRMTKKRFPKISKYKGRSNITSEVTDKEEKTMLDEKYIELLTLIQIIFSEENCQRISSDPNLHLSEEFIRDFMINDKGRIDWSYLQLPEENELKKSKP